MKTAARWTVPPDHPAFAGHFPGTPIVPGVVLLDEALRAVAADSGRSLEGCELGSVKFLSPVGPGQTLEFQYQDTPGGGLRIDIVAEDGTRIASGSISAGAPS